MAKGKGKKDDDGCSPCCCFCFCLLIPWIVILIGVVMLLSGNTRVQRIEEYSI